MHAAAKSRADVAQLVEHSLGKGEVISSILIIGSRNQKSIFLRADSGELTAGFKAGVTQW